MLMKRKIYCFVVKFVSALTAISCMYNTYSAVYAYDYISYGIDVSSFQESIDWNAVANDNNIDFAIIRAGTTTRLNGDEYRKDDYFDVNYENAKNAGLKVGAYYFCGAYTEEGFIKNAYDFLESVDGRTFDFPVYIDLEQASMQMELGKDTLTSYVLSALAIIKDAGYVTGVYANLNWFRNYVDAQRIKDAGYEIWLARYPSGSYAVDPTDYDESDFGGVWQYSSLGSINGIYGNADVDVSYIDYPVSDIPEPQPPVQEYSTGIYAVNTPSGVRVRSEAGGGSVLSASPNGTRCEITAVSGQWGYTEAIGGWTNDDWTIKSGWIPLIYCEFIEPLSTVEIITTETTTTTETTETTTITETTETTTTENTVNGEFVVLPKELTISKDEMYTPVVINCPDPENITWITSNKNIAQVDNGVIKGISAGSTRIYAVYEHQYAEIELTVTKKILIGDINDDEKIDSKDAEILNNYILGSRTLTENEYNMADINSDGVVDVFDMMEMRNKI